MTTTDPYGIADLYDSDLSQSYSIFMPAVTVFDNGDIDIDFSDCYVNTSGHSHVEPDDRPHSALLDRIVTGHDVDLPGALRRLADYIANQRRPEFPVDDVEDNVCPSCGHEGSLQYTDVDARFWDFARFDGHDGRTMLFQGEFDWVGDGADDHLTCWNCQAEWKRPATVDFI